MHQLISYSIKRGNPSWPGNPTYDITPYTSIKKGDICNTYMIHLFNHYGTHFDAPLHFNENGLSIASLPFTQFIYQKPLLLDIPRNPGEKIEPKDLILYSDRIATCDLLMIRTGFFKVRREQPNIYETEGPAISSRAARYLIEHFPNIKAVALDFISLASYGDQSDGNLAHQYMLGKFNNHYICIIEDVDLGRVPAEDLKSATAIPLMIEDVDSCPVTMWVEF
jgi:kynurenine formamidase